MRTWKQLRHGALSCMLLLACHYSAQAKVPLSQRPLAKAVSQKPVSQRPFFFRINQFYVLYTNPVVPYVDPQGHLMVGMDGIKSLLTLPKQKPHYPGDDYDKASLTEDVRAGTAVFSLADHSIRFAAHSTEAQRLYRKVSLVLTASA